MSDTLERQTEAEVAVHRPGPVATTTTRANRWVSAVVPPVIVGVLFLLLWMFVTYVVLAPTKRFLLPPPQDVIRVGLIEDGAWKEQFTSLWYTTLVAGQGLLIAIVLGMVLATIMSQSKLFENAIFPYAVVVQAVPILALVPLIQFWFGTGNEARVIVCVIIALFPIILNTLFGLQSADQGLHDLLTLHRASRWTRLRKLMFPAALPAIFAGLRISAGLSVIGAIVGDFFFGQGRTGIGQDLKNYARQLDGEKLFAAVGLACALGVSVFLFFGWLRNRMISKWYESTSS